MWAPAFLHASIWGVESSSNQRRLQLVDAIRQDHIHDIPIRLVVLSKAG